MLAVPVEKLSFNIHIEAAAFQNLIYIGIINVFLQTEEVQCFEVSNQTCF